MLESCTVAGTCSTSWSCTCSSSSSSPWWAYSSSTGSSSSATTSQSQQLQSASKWIYISVGFILIGNALNEKILIQNRLNKLIYLHNMIEDKFLQIPIWKAKLCILHSAVNLAILKDVGKVNFANFSSTRNFFSVCLKSHVFCINNLKLAELVPSSSFPLFRHIIFSNKF